MILASPTPTAGWRGTNRVMTSDAVAALPDTCSTVHTREVLDKTCPGLGAPGGLRRKSTEALTIRHLELYREALLLQPPGGWPAPGRALCARQPRWRGPGIAGPAGHRPTGPTMRPGTGPSNDGKLMAFGMYRSGDENSVLYVMDVLDSGDWLAKEIPGKGGRFAGWRTTAASTTGALKTWTTLTPTLSNCTDWARTTARTGCCFANATWIFSMGTWTSLG